MESQPSPVPAQQVVHVHHFGLEGVETVESDRNQIVEQLVHVAAAVYHHVFSGLTDTAVHALQAGIDKLFPEVVSHDQSDLLSPVVAEVNRVDVVFEGFVDLAQVVVADRVEQLVHELGIDVEIHQQVFDAPQRPCPFVERESDLEHTEHVGLFADFAFDVGEEARVERIGKRVAFERGVFEDAALHVADILVYAAVPNHAEDIADIVAAQIFEEADVASQLQDMVAQYRVEVIRVVVLHESLFRLFGEFERPRNVRRLFTVEDALDYFSFGHIVGL